MDPFQQIKQLGYATRNRYVTRRRLKLYAPMLVLVLLFIYLWPLCGAQFDSRFSESYGGDAAPRPEPAASSSAIEIVRESGVVEAINGGQEWVVDTNISPPRTPLHGRAGTALEIVWATPVESSGPWSAIRCNGSRKYVHKQRFSDINRLVVYVDLDAEVVVGYRESPNKTDGRRPVVGAFNAFGLAHANDVQSGDYLISGPQIMLGYPPLLCPPGWYSRG